MKIICFSNIDGEVKMVLKGDSSLLVNRKPFFIPEWSNDIRMTPCMVFRVSRLGKNIGAKCAERYYDACAPGANIIAADFVAKGDWTYGFAFDYSLVLGEMGHIALSDEGLVIGISEAVEKASSIMTIRQGDLIVIDKAIASRKLEAEELLCVEHDGKEILYCKIK